MSERPQKFQLDNNLYERPNDKWSCGARAAGMPCSTGPDSSGRCGAICQPIKDGDRFYCASATKHSGDCDVGPTEDGRCCTLPPQCVPKKFKSKLTGESEWKSTRGICPRGPLPDGNCCRTLEQCSPVRSVMARRKHFTLAAFSGAIGLVLIMIAFPGPKKAISPGPLFQTHASLIGDCRQCHDHDHSPIVTSLYPDIDKPTGEDGSGPAGDQTARCLHCHHELHNGPEDSDVDYGRYIHNTAPETLARLSRKQVDLREARDNKKDNQAQSYADYVKLYSSTQKACAECHQEHRGPEFDIKAMTDRQCQSCHMNQFTSFDNGHPAFTNYPHDKRANIYFDHATHFRVHFADHQRIAGIEASLSNQLSLESGTAACATCHQSDSGGFMKTKGFEDTCAECHDYQIQNPLASIDFLAIPDWVFSADDVQLSDRLKTFESSNRLGFSPMAIALLDREPAFRQALEELMKEPGVTEGSEPPTELVDGPLASVRLSLDGVLNQLQVTQESAPVGPAPPSDDEGNAEAMSAESTNLQGLAQRLFSDRLEPTDLQRFVNRFPVDQVGQFATMLDDRDTSFAEPNLLDANWMTEYQNSTYTLKYRPTGHADPMLQEWINSLATVAEDMAMNSSSASSNSEQTMFREYQFDLFEQFAGSLSAGRCTKCHSMDADVGQGVVHWQSSSNMLTNRKEFEKFSHLPHMTRQLQCTDCHEVMPEDSIEFSKSQFLSAPRGLPNVSSNHPFSVGIGPLNISDCRRCHNSSGDSQSCTTCHNYHVLQHSD